LGRLFWRRCSQWATTFAKILFIFLWCINFSSPPTLGASDVPCLPRCRGDANLIRFSLEVGVPFNETWCLI
jgi:hypothetical protein